MLFSEGSEIFSYRKIAHSRVTSEQLSQCSILFSKQYGIWGRQGPRPGLPVTMKATTLRKTFLNDDGAFLVLAIDEESDTLAGHAFARRFSVPSLGGNVLWITQLVVNTVYRNCGVGTHLISNALDHRDLCAGLVTSHPYAVRALERACRKTVSAHFAATYGQDIIEASGVGYLEGRSINLLDGCCKIDTGFHVNHTEVNGIIAELNRQPASGWLLGTINDGEEFVAVVDLRT